MLVVNNIEVLYDRVTLVLKGVSLTGTCGTVAPDRPYAPQVE